MNDSPSFEEQEALHFLLEDNELALIELKTELNQKDKESRIARLFSPMDDDNLTFVFQELFFNSLQQRALLEMEFLREINNNTFLRSILKRWAQP